MHRTSKKLHEEPDLTHRLDLMRDLGLHDAGRFGREKLLLGLWFEDEVSKGACENPDACPDAGLRRVTTS